MPTILEVKRLFTVSQMKKERLTREEIYLAFAQLWSMRSVCKRFQVGAVLTDTRMRTVLGVGYNGPARGLPHDRCRKDKPGECGCIHAEMNAIAGSISKNEDKILFVTVTPCEMCAQLIIQHGVICVHVLGDYRDPSGVSLLREAGVEVCQWLQLT